MLTHKYIAVEGPIGVGKTSLAEILAKKLNSRLILEGAVENPFISEFYKDMEKYAFQTQMFFLLSRYRQQQDMLQSDLFQQGIVSDYVFAKDRIFANLNLGDNELKLYESDPFDPHGPGLEAGLRHLSPGLHGCPFEAYLHEGPEIRKPNHRGLPGGIKPGL